MLNGKSILLTGGTGSFGKKFTELVLQKYPKIKRFVIYSRDELKQHDMAIEYPKEKYSNIRFFIGDVRDFRRLKQACEQIDIIVHAAALKQVPTLEYNPFEAVKTNVIGAQNIIDAALETNIQVVISLSTDKAAAPINLYGATKLTSDKLFIAANNIKGKRDIRFTVVRYGNVMGSRGSVIPLFLQKRLEGILPITHPDMTRFNITREYGVEIVLSAIRNSLGGEIIIPKIPSYKILDLAEAIAPKAKHIITGIRPGEKIHEEMITESDSYNTLDIGKCFIILPSFGNPHNYIKFYNGKYVPQGFKYNSGFNTDWLSVNDLRLLIRKYIDKSFNHL